MTIHTTYDIMNTTKGGIPIGKTKAEIQRNYSKRSNYAAQKKYDKENTITCTIRLVKTTEADIIDQLELQENKSGYIKDLIRADIYKTKK